MRIYGKNCVLERLRVNPQSIKKIYIETGTSHTSVVNKKANSAKIAVYNIAPSKMIKIARNKNTQGVLADTFDFEYVPYEELIKNALKNKRTPVFLDGLTDPQNFGAIIRSLGCLGKFCLILPSHDSVSVTETVLRVASGGDNHVPLAKVSNLRKAIKTAQDLGFWIMGAIVDAKENIAEIKLNWPVGVVIGSEQKGIRDIIRKQLDQEIAIAMPVSTMSFNVGHATSIICYEITKQKRK